MRLRRSIPVGPTLALAVTSPRLHAQALTTLFCNDTPLGFEWLLRWEGVMAGTPPARQPIGGVPTGGEQEARAGSDAPLGCGVEWFLVVFRSNYRPEAPLGANLFDELLFDMTHRVAPDTPDHREPLNPNALSLHVDGGVLSNLGPAPDLRPVPAAAMAPFGAPHAPPRVVVDHPTRSHVDVVRSFEYQIAGDGITFRIVGEHSVVPEPSTVALVATGALGVAAIGRRRRQRSTPG